MSVAMAIVEDIVRLTLILGVSKMGDVLGRGVVLNYLLLLPIRKGRL